jgi:hypothetical protein
MVRISDLINRLHELQDKHGDVPVRILNEYTAVTDDIESLDAIQYVAKTFKDYSDWDYEFVLIGRAL